MHLHGGRGNQTPQSDSPFCLGDAREVEFANHETSLESPAADKGSFEGSATLTDAQADELLAGKWYVNVHTAANKGGEVRGQVTK